MPGASLVLAQRLALGESLAVRWKVAGLIPQPSKNRIVTRITAVIEVGEYDC